MATRVRGDGRPWTPLGLASSPFAVGAGSDTRAEFSVVEHATGELAGAAVLWGIDQHNRSAHVGLDLLPRFRGRRLSGDVLHVLTRYGFEILGLNRLQLETLVDNAAMIAAATRVGYCHEGLLRQGSWATGGFVDEILMSVPADEWRSS